MLVLVALVDMVVERNCAGMRPEIGEIDVSKALYGVVRGRDDLVVCFLEHGIGWRELEETFMVMIMSQRRRAHEKFVHDDVWEDVCKQEV